MSSLEEKKNDPRKPNPSKIIPKNNLRKIRILKNQKFSQWMLALKSGVPQSRISLIENSLIKPTRRECERLASALEINGSDLFPQVDLEVPVQNRKVVSQRPQGEEIEGPNPLENLIK